MNYALHYNRLMARAAALGRLDCYQERHHVNPVCLGGQNDRQNLVWLTPEEHFVAHQLLVKMNPGHRGLAYAAIGMTAHHTGKRVNNKRFGWLKRQLSESMKGKPNLANRKPMSAATKAKLSASTKGKPKLANRGKVRTVKQKLAMSAVSKSAWNNEEYCEKMKQRRPRGPRTAAEKQQVAKLNSARVWTADSRAKVSAANKGRTPPPLSLEARTKISLAKRAWWAARRGA